MSVKNNQIAWRPMFLKSFPYCSYQLIILPSANKPSHPVYLNHRIYITLYKWPTLTRTPYRSSSPPFHPPLSLSFPFFRAALQFFFSRCLFLFLSFFFTLASSICSAVRGIDFFWLFLSFKCRWCGISKDLLGKVRGVRGVFISIVFIWVERGWSGNYRFKVGVVGTHGLTGIEWWVSRRRLRCTRGWWRQTGLGGWW